MLLFPASTRLDHQAACGLFGHPIGWSPLLRERSFTSFIENTRDVFGVSPSGEGSGLIVLEGLAGLPPQRDLSDLTTKTVFPSLMACRPLRDGMPKQALPVQPESAELTEWRSSRCASSVGDPQNNNLAPRTRGSGWSKTFGSEANDLSAEPGHSSTFWIKSSARRAFGGCLGNKRR